VPHPLAASVYAVRISYFAAIGEQPLAPYQRGGAAAALRYAWLSYSGGRQTFGATSSEQAFVAQTSARASACERNGWRVTLRRWR